MAVMDASVVVEMLLGTARGQDAIDSALADPNGMHAPHLLDAEVTHALRRLVLMREITAQDAQSAIDALPQLRLDRYAHLLLLPRVWELRDSLTAYDAFYVALAEILRLPLMTCDGKLSRSHGHSAEIVLLD
jgi:predicted nucleic acid-binding protein